MNRFAFSFATGFSALFFAMQTLPAAESAKRLHALFENEWDYTMEQFPTWASQLGDRRWNDRWEDISLGAIQNRIAHTKKTLENLRAIDRTKLSTADQLNYDLFQQRYTLELEESGFQIYLIPLTQRDGIQLADELADALRFTTRKDYEDWIARLRAFGTYMDQTIALMREGVRARLLQPKVTMQ